MKMAIWEMASAQLPKIPYVCGYFCTTVRMRENAYDKWGRGQVNVS